jgi:RNA polymerase sigma factor (sigma-70 family)
MAEESRDDPVTVWIEQLRAGDENAATRLFRHYYDRAIRVAQRHLDGVRCREKDGEDIAASVFDSLFCDARQGQYAEFRERGAFWRLIRKITVGKTRDQIRRLRAQKRAPEFGESALAGLADSRGVAGIGQAPGSQRPPDELAAVAENIERLLNLLPDPKLRMVAVLKFAGHTHAEVAAKLECSETTIERNLRRIREIWSKELA